jgi:hypothetical protein
MLELRGILSPKHHLRTVAVGFVPLISNSFANPLYVSLFLFLKSNNFIAKYI